MDAVDDLKVSLEGQYETSINCGCSHCASDEDAHAIEGPRCDTHESGYL